MGNKATLKVHINKEHFLKVLHTKKYSIRQLGEAYNEIGRTEKTIRRCLNAEEMPPDLLDKISKYLNVHPDYLSGTCFYKIDRQFEEPYWRAIFKSYITPKTHPYLLKEKSSIDYPTYFNSILTMNDISIEQFQALSPEERILIREEIAAAIMQVIDKHFTQDVFGNSIAEKLCYYQSQVGDYDPNTYFAYLEGLSLPD